MRVGKWVLTWALMVSVVAPAIADWDPGDPFKMHYPQLPDQFGWDVRLHDWILADDFLCTETGPITDIHLWVSFQAWSDPIPPPILPTLGLSIWTDIPDPDGPQGPLWSMPSNMVWNAVADPSAYTIRYYGDGQEGWYDPSTGQFIMPDHFTYYQINIKVADPFLQEAGNIYWLGVQQIDLPPFEMGWKTTQDHFNDDAVWGFPPPGGIWNELRDPETTESLDLAFVIVPEPGTGLFLLVAGLGALLRRRWVNR